jgi:hypothetical protein
MALFLVLTLRANSSWVRIHDLFTRLAQHGPQFEILVALAIFLGKSRVIFSLSSNPNLTF